MYSDEILKCYNQLIIILIVSLNILIKYATDSLNGRPTHFSLPHSGRKLKRLDKAATQ